MLKDILFHIVPLMTKLKALMEITENIFAWLDQQNSNSHTIITKLLKANSQPIVIDHSKEDLDRTNEF